MNIANIVTDTDLTLEELFNVVNDIKDIDGDKPTLVIGYNKSRELFGDALPMLERKFDDKMFWTFKKNERRMYHDEDLYNFIKYSYENIIKNVSYHYIDPIHSTDEYNKEIFDKIKNNDDVVTFYDGVRMIYIYTENSIFGIDTHMSEYLGKSTKKILRWLNKYSSVFLQNNEILIEYGDYLNRIDNQIKYIPLIYSLKNG